VATLLILLVDASLHSTSSKTTQELSAGTWMDRVLPIISATNQEGQLIAAVWANGLKLPASTIVSELEQTATGASQAYQEAVRLKAPPELAGPAGLLEACLLSRSQAAAALQKSMSGFVTTSAKAAPQTSTTAPTTSGGAAASSTVPSSTTSSTSTSTTSTTSTSTTVPTGIGAVGGPPVAPVVLAAAASLATVVDDMQVGDQAYHLFWLSMSRKVPPSRWLADPSPYSPQHAEIFLTTLQNSISTQQVDEVKIYSLSTNPAPVSKQGGTEILPLSTVLYATFVVANTGNQAANDLTVTASITPAGLGATSVRDFVNLQPGQLHTVVGLGPVSPPEGVPVTLSIQVTPPVGSSIPVATLNLVFEMPTPNSTSSTTSVPTSVPATSSTSAG
jgi:hypothetical protein